MAAIAAEVIAEVRRIASRADTSNIDGWFKRIIDSIVAVLAAAWKVIQELTGDYLTDHAALEGRQVEPVFSEWNTEQVLTSMRVQGPVAFKKAIASGKTEDEAKASMASALAGAAGRLVRNGGRETIADTVEKSIEDKGNIVGWRRVGDGDPCAWCAMLISRGAVYGSEASASRVVGRAGISRAPGKRAIGEDYHDWCNCIAEPLYEFEDEPAEVDEIYQQWLDVTEGKSFKEALRAWREYWDGKREKPQRRAAEQPPVDVAPAQERAATRDATADAEVVDVPPAEEAKPEPKAKLTPEDKAEAARKRQAHIDFVRARANILSEAGETIINDSGEDLTRRLLTAAIKRAKLEDDPLMRRVLAAVTDDPDDLRAAIEEAAGELGLTRIGSNNPIMIRNRYGDFKVERVRFDRALHKPIDGDLRPGQEADIVRPGFQLDIDGKRLVLDKATVMTASEDPVIDVPTPKKDEPASKFHSTLAGLEDLAAIARDAGSARRDRLAGGMSADVELVKLDDGRIAVHKRGREWSDDPQEVAESIRSQADAEQLAALVGDAIGAKVPKVYRDAADAVWMEYIDGATFDTDDLLDSRDGVLLGLLDVLAVNPDRNGGNLLAKNGRLIGIDHGVAWASHLREEGLDRPQISPGSAYGREPAHHFITPDREWADNPLTPQDIEELRKRLIRLRPDFDKVGRRDWLDYTLQVLAKLAGFAKGKVPFYG